MRKIDLEILGYESFIDYMNGYTGYGEFDITHFKDRMHKIERKLADINLIRNNAD